MVTQASLDLVGKLQQLKNRENHVFLPERPSQEPLTLAIKTMMINGLRLSTRPLRQPAKLRNWALPCRMSMIS